MDKLDILLQKHPINVPIREHLTRDTLSAMTQIKRIRLARHMLVALFIITTLLFIAKWLSNDLGYLLLIALHKFSFVKNQSSLYWSAFWESLPKQQLLTVFVASILWLGWKRFETFLLHSRITHTKQTFAMKLILMIPRLLIINTLVVTTAIGFAGYSYAKKTEQQKLQILREHVNQSGRTEFETNLPENKCDATNNQNLTNLYEIKKGTNINSTDAVKIIEAACTNAEAERFLHQVFPLGSKVNYRLEENATTNSTTIVSQVVEKNGDSLSIKPPSVAYDPNPTPIAYTLSPDTKVYKDTKLVSQETIKKGDIVMLINKLRYASAQGGDLISSTALGVYILPSKPTFNWYNLSLQHAVTQIETCPGNPQDRCTFTGSIDFFPSGGGEGNTVNPAHIQHPKGMMKEIAGVLTEINETSVKIKTSSGRIVTIEFGSNPIEDFNRDRAQYYNNDKVTLGDTLLVRYSELANSHSTTINTDQIFNAVLMIEVVNKTDPVKKY